MNHKYNVLEAIDAGVSLLERTDNPRLESEVLLSHILNVPRSWLIAHPSKPLSLTNQTQFINIVNRRKEGLPLPYLLGHWEFFGLDFLVDKHVLIPRPETELLVEIAISISNKLKRPLVADIGTGSGNIAVSLAYKVPKALLIASDISFNALLLAKTNSLKHKTSRQIQFVQADLLKGLPKVDIICANLPYLTTHETFTLEVGLNEPHLALNGGHNGLKYIKQTIITAKSHLREHGTLLLEFGDNLETIMQIVARCFADAKLTTHYDLARRPRILQVST
ncbi:MAG TPA: peptide chain release factor N(5)-glutamine methyltransferase [Chloroflexi bacterium]|nr:peptide chain release factor N(5)-glutamine methyltransferase [Chloroflexota bacterium]|tara:strand:- start:482 stop:1318 length:837 start_codon:yes stop_codon:yes gene_type:complete